MNGFFLISPGSKLGYARQFRHVSLSLPLSQLDFFTHNKSINLSVCMNKGNVTV